jgi:hypothetical protein
MPATRDVMIVRVYMEGGRTIYDIDGAQYHAAVDVLEGRFDSRGQWIVWDAYEPSNLCSHCGRGDAPQRVTTPTILDGIERGFLVPIPAKPA